MPGEASAVAQPSLGGKDTWVLHVGDSFVHASFQQNLGPHVRSTGSGYVVDARTATYTTTWANDADFDLWLARRPSLVVVTLGANEAEMPDPAEHAAPVERIARKIAASGASCVWVTPPMWKRDSGILRVIHDHAAPCLFFDSDAVLGGLGEDERQRDHIHPNERGGARWAAAFWSWLEDHRDASRPGWALEPYEVRGG
jgi:lysophospholipase L1-like esterase